MLVSITTPTHNRPEFLLQALQSIQRQSFPDWEALVIDDGDGSGMQLANSLADKRICAFQNPLKGQIKARNYALAKARGEVIAWLDDDDWWDDPKHLEKNVALLSSQPALIYRPGWLIRELDNGARLWQVFDLPTTEQSLKKDNSLLTCGIAYPKRFHDELGKFDLEVGGYFDWDWCLRIIKAGYPLQKLQGAGVCYRVHSSNVSQQLGNPTRINFFRHFCQKHSLELIMKNHQSLFEKG